MTIEESFDHQMDPHEGFPQESARGSLARNPLVLGGAAVVLLIVMFMWTRDANNATRSSLPVAGTLLSGQGTKRYDKAASGTNFVTLPVPTSVNEGDWLVFGDSTENILTWPNKSSLRFGPESAVTLSRARVDSSGGMQYLLDFTQGRMWVRSSATDSFEINAKEAAIKAKPGAVFEVSVAVDDKAYTVTTVKVYSGSLELGGRTKASDRITVNAPQTAKVNDDRLFPAEAFDVTQNDAWENWNLSWTDDPKTQGAATAAQAAPGETPATGSTPPPQPGAPPAGAPPPTQGAQTGPPPPPGPGAPPPGVGVPPGKPQPHRPPSVPTQPKPVAQPHQPPPVPVQPPPQQPAQQPVQQPVQKPAPAPTQTSLPPPVYAPGATTTPPTQPGGGSNPPPSKPGDAGGLPGKPPPGGDYPGGMPGAPATVLPDTRPIGY